MSGRSPDYRLRGAFVPRTLFPNGTVRFSLGVPPGTKTRGNIAARRREALNRLRFWEKGWDVLKAITDGRLDVGEVCLAIRRHGENSAGELLEKLESEALGPVPSFRDEMKAYLKAVSHRLRASTLSAVKSRLKRFAEQRRPNSAGEEEGAVLGNLPINQITSADVTRAVRTMSEKSNRREDIRIAVSGLYSWSIDEEQARADGANCKPRWTNNPAQTAEKFARESRVRVLNGSEVESLLEVAEPYQERYLRSFLQLGFRESEYIHTRFGLDLNTATWEWRIQGRAPDPRCRCSACRGKGWKPKARRSWRTLEIPEELIELRQGIVQELKAYDAKRGDFVFRNPRTGKVWHARSLADDFASLCRRAGVPYGREVEVERNGVRFREEGVTLHSLRHTCATNLLRAGVQIHTVAEILGDTVETVASTYSHLVPRDLAKGIRQGPQFRIRTS